MIQLVLGVLRHPAKDVNRIEHTGSGQDIHTYENRPVDGKNVIKCQSFKYCIICCNALGSL